MISVGTMQMSRTSTELEKVAIDFSDWLVDPDGSATTISGTPTVAGINCTPVYVSNSAGIVNATAVLATGLGKGAKGEIKMTVVFANGVKLTRKVDLDFI